MAYIFRTVEECQELQDLLYNTHITYLVFVAMVTAFSFTNQPDSQVLMLYITLCVCVCVFETGMQGQEKLLFTVCHHICTTEQPPPPAEKDMAKHRQVGVCVFVYISSFCMMG